jgi:acyl carrier protein
LPFHFALSARAAVGGVQRFGAGVSPPGLPLAFSCLRRRRFVTIDDQVFEIVSEQLSVPREEITRESSFVDDLKADSLDVVELVMRFEDTFGVTIPDEDYEKIRTVGDAIDYIEQKEQS